MVSIPIIPHHVASGAAIDDETVTSVNDSVGGIAGRQRVRGLRRIFTCTVGPDYTPVVRAIHNTHRQRWPVAIRDWGHYIFEDQDLVYTSNGSSFLAPLRRLIQPAPGTRYLYQRVLIPDETEVPVILKVDGTPLLRSNWEMDNFGIPNIPTEFIPSGSILTWSGRCLVPACFMVGTLSIQINSKQIGVTEFGIQSIPQVQFKEILEPELIRLMAEQDDSL